MVSRRATPVALSLIPWAAFLLTLALLDPVPLDLARAAIGYLCFVVLPLGVVLVAGRAIASRLRR